MQMGKLFLHAVLGSMTWIQSRHPQPYQEWSWKSIIALKHCWEWLLKKEISNYNKLYINKIYQNIFPIEVLWLTLLFLMISWVYTPISLPERPLPPVISQGPFRVQLFPTPGSSVLSTYSQICCLWPFYSLSMILYPTYERDMSLSLILT